MKNTICLLFTATVLLAADATLCKIDVKQRLSDVKESMSDMKTSIKQKFSGERLNPMLVINLPYQGNSTGLYVAVKEVSDESLVVAIKPVSADSLSLYKTGSPSQVADVTLHKHKQKKGGMPMLGAPSGDQVFRFVLDRDKLIKAGKFTVTFGYYRKPGETVGPDKVFEVSVAEGSKLSCAHKEQEGVNYVGSHCSLVNA